MLSFFQKLLDKQTTHDVTWSTKDRYCEDQYVTIEEPEESPSCPVKTEIMMLPSANTFRPFEKFNFDMEVAFDD